MINKDKTVLVTGADGFIGSHLVELLLAHGYRVRALSQYNSFNYWGWLEDIAQNDRLEVVCGDVRDPNYCREIARDCGTVFHLAALIAIPYSYVAPDSSSTPTSAALSICVRRHAMLSATASSSPPPASLRYRTIRPNRRKTPSATPVPIFCYKNRR